MAGNGDQKRKTCFIVMPITTPATYMEQEGDPIHFTHVLEDLFVPALESLGYQVLLPSVAGSELIQAEIIKNLEQADLVLCDLSSLNPNVFFELGIRTALDRPIVLVRDKLTPQIPFDINAINVLTYDGSLKSWTMKAEISRLADHIRASVKSPSGTGNPMWRYFGLTQRAGPAEIENPTDAKLGLILSELAKLSQSRGAEANYRRNSAVVDVGGSRYRILEPIRIDESGLAQSSIEKLLRSAYRGGVNFGLSVRMDATDTLIGELMRTKPRIPDDVEYSLINESGLRPDSDLRYVEVRDELRKGFWDGFESNISAPRTADLENGPRIHVDTRTGGRSPNLHNVGNALSKLSARAANTLDEQS